MDQLPAETKQAELRRIVRAAMNRRRQALTYVLARKCFGLLEDMAIDPAAGSSGDQQDWIRIESLSRLRALVGGRFQNLKDRWVRAGFPLREHRGDRSGKKAVDYDGWVELSTWIHKQGFEIRLAAEEDPWLFEIRTASPSK